MTVLIKQKLPGQKRARTCSALCYNAKGPVCCCVCGGVNHGVGFRQAAENTAKAAEELQKRAQEEGALIQIRKEVIS